MKRKRYADIEDTERVTTVILNIISNDEIKIYFNSLLDREMRCINFEGDYYE